MNNWSADSFSIMIPEIYQLESTNVCNLFCPACIRQDERVKRKLGFLDPELLRTMINRLDFDGSFFVELQMYGEPTLHPRLHEIVLLLKSIGLKVGLSTNGTLMRENLLALEKLDYMTISIDSVDKETYEKCRGTSFEDLIESIDIVTTACPKTKIDLQVINFGGKDELSGLVALAQHRKWKVTCRAVPDCFAAYQGRPFPKQNMNQLCLNPWLSVSVQYDGDVVPCCFSAGKFIVYGNLYQNSLKEIWNTSPVKAHLMERMMYDYNKHEIPCMLCYMRSPTLFHTKMLMENLKKS